MKDRRREAPATFAARGKFTTTHWSLVMAAGDSASPRSREALAELCQTYWYPLYAYARRRGKSSEEAQDLAQEFFTRLLEKEGLRGVDPRKGRFRSFLLTSFKNFIVDEGIRASAKKRGGGKAPVSIDLETAEGRYALEPAHEETPEKIFERRWVMTLLQRAMERFREEHRRSNRERVFEQLQVYLTGERGAVPYAQTARALGMSEVSIKVAIHRFRRRFHSVLREEIAQTVGSEEEVQDELRYLFSALE
jgi:RNA polymerase sigma factor (sigma-70 family)